jgi:hypothetical protein
LTGPTIEIKITSEDGDSRTWGLPKALLSHHSTYFQRACRSEIFTEGQTNKVEIRDFEPETFEMFVEFMYFDRYTYKDDLTDYLRVRDSAKAWVLGDYIDAVGFKNFAIRNLYNIYMPSGIDANPKTGIGPEMVDYCCSRTLPNSHLSELVKVFLIHNWHSVALIRYDYPTDSWNAIWDRHAEFRNDLLYLTQQSIDGRQRDRDVNNYLEQLTVVDETAQ